MAEYEQGPLIQRLRGLSSSEVQLVAGALRERLCRKPYRLEDGRLVRCGSRFAEVCPSCAHLAFGDWSAILRSGAMDERAAASSFVLLTCTAPSFGAVHRVPRGPGRVWCPCTRFHTAYDADLTGTPVDYGSYDFPAAVRFNRDIGLLWDRTRRELTRIYPGVEYAKVWEPQARLVLHTHVLLRVPARAPVDPATLIAVVRSVTGRNSIDGRTWSWGRQVDAMILASPVGGNGGNAMASVIGYVVKAINYMGKSIQQQASSPGQRHMHEMHRAAREMRCERCQEAAEASAGWVCQSKLHLRFGMRSVVVTTSRAGKDKPGWSYSHLTRTVQREQRRQYVVNA